MVIIKILITIIVMLVPIFISDTNEAQFQHISLHPIMYFILHTTIIAIYM